MSQSSLAIAEDLLNATDTLNRLAQLVTNSLLQAPVKTILNGVTASACRVVRLAERAKKNKNDAKTLALHIADITERSIQWAVSSSNNGTVDDTLFTNIIRWQQRTDEVAGELEKLTRWIVSKYKDDRLKVPIFDRRTESIVSSVRAGIEGEHHAAMAIPAPFEATAGANDAAPANITVESGIETREDPRQTSECNPAPPNSLDASLITSIASAPAAAIPTSVAIPTQPTKSSYPMPVGPNTSERSGSNTRLPLASGSPPGALVKAMATTAYQAFKLTVPMIPSPPGDIVALIIGVGEQIASIVDNVKSNPEKATALINKVQRLTQIVCQLLAHRVLQDLPTSTEEHLKEILKDLQSVRDTVNKQVEQNRLSQAILASENSAALDSCAVWIDGAYRSLDLLINADSHRKLTILESDSLLDRLGSADNGATDKANDIKDMACLPGTRTAILARIDGWISDQDTANRVFWLSGPAGSGKTAVTATIESKRGTDTVMASFYFSRGNEVRNRRAIPVIARQLAMWGHGCLKRFFVAAIDANRDLVTAHLNLQFEGLIAEPMRKMVPGTPPALVILDGLDECEDKAYVRTLLRLIRSLDNVSTPVKFLITSRPEEDVRREMNPTPRCKVEHRTLRDDENTATINHDIGAYLRKGLKEVAENNEAGTWPEPSAMAKLVDLADGLFQWASTVVTYIGNGDPTTRLSDILNSYIPLKGLNNMYDFILGQAAIAQSEVRPHLLQDVLGAITVARTPLTPAQLSYILSDATTNYTITADQIQGEVLRHLQSILVILTTSETPRDQQHIIFIHASVGDYLTETCKDARFRVNTRVHHAEMADRCLRRMACDLRQDICKIGNPAKPNKDVEDLTERLARLPAGLTYCCVWWAAHLGGSTSGMGKEITTGEQNMRSGYTKGGQKRYMEKLLDGLRVFAEVHLLHWMELLSLLSQTTEMVAILHVADAWVSEHLPEGAEQHKVSELLYDGIHFVNDLRNIVSVSALQTYHSALPFSPESSLLRRTYDPTVQTAIRVVRGALPHWSQCRWIGTRHEKDIRCLAISPDGITVVSGSSDGIIILWDRKTGAARCDMKGHTMRVTCLAISRNGKTVASGSWDKTVRLWDLETEKARGPALEGHTSWVTCLAISPDGKTVASGSMDNTVRLWDLDSEKARGPALEGHTGWVSCLAISRDGKTVASGSWDKTVRLWDLETEKARGPVLEGHTSWVTCLAISPDGKTVASGSMDNTVRLWDLDSEKARGPALEGHTDWVSCLAISPDGRTVASGSWDNTVRLWDLETGKARGPVLEGHITGVSCLAIPPNGQIVASGSSDTTIRLWDLQTGKARGPALEGHSGSVYRIAISPDGKTVASVSEDKTVRLWDLESGKAKGPTLEGHTGWVTCLAISPDRKTVASGSWDKTVRLWDLEAGKARGSALEGHTSRVSCLAISPDGKTVASGSEDKTVRLWDLESGKARGPPLNGRSDRVHRLAISPDGKAVASQSYDHTPPLCDICGIISPALVSPRIDLQLTSGFLFFRGGLVL
ncbi:hypothetical protein FRB97_001200 [Tulasnella sp. 331]|nr:hypothetical protein FRB97_001200 [Tulasnella sp. 331]